MGPMGFPRFCEIRSRSCPMGPKGFPRDRMDGPMDCSMGPMVLLMDCCIFEDEFRYYYVFPEIQRSISKTIGPMEQSLRPSIARCHSP